MREQAHVIQSEVAHLMDDLSRLDERVRKLQGHFAMAQKDVDMIVTSADKLARRGERIEALEFEAAKEPAKARTEERPKPVDNRTSQLKLRVVDED
jgi:DNA recombination protein RmuC